MKLSEWARRNGVHYQTAWKWARDETILEANGRRVVVIDAAEVDGDLVRNMTEVFTWFRARLYGRRSASRCAKAAPRAAREVA